MYRMGRDESRPLQVGQTLRRVEGGGHYILAILAHAGIAFGFLGIGFLASLAISVGIWLFSKRSRYLYFQAEQAGLYQFIVFVVNLAGALLLIAGVLVFLRFGFGAAAPVPGTFEDILIKLLALVLLLSAPLYIIWYVGTILYGIYAAIMVAAGREFRYPVIAGWIDRRVKRQRE